MRSALGYDVAIPQDDARGAKASEWVDAYMRVFEIAGHGDEACAALRTRIDALPWVDCLSDAHMAITSFELFQPPGPATPEACDTYVAAKRTWYAATNDERTRYMAGFLGVSQERMTVWAGELGREPIPPSGRCALYRHFDADGALLYVGISATPDLRTSQHRAQSPWFPLVSESATEWFESRAEAESAERAAIEAEGPLFNQTHNKKSRDRVVRYLLERVTSVEVAS